MARNTIWTIRVTQNHMSKCTARNKDGSKCERPSKKGWSVCYHHGAEGGRPITTIDKARTMRDNRTALDVARSFAFSPEMMNLEQIVSTVYRIVEMVQNTLAQYGDTITEENEQQVTALSNLLKDAAKIVKIKADADNAGALTIKELAQLQIELSRFLAELPENERIGAIERLKAADYLRDATHQIMPFIGALSNDEKDEALHVLRSHFANPKRKVVNS